MTEREAQLTLKNIVFSLIINCGLAASILSAVWGMFLYLVI